MFGTAARLSGAVVDATGRRIEGAVLAGIDVTLSSRLVEQAIDRIIASGVLERTVDRVFDEDRVIDEVVKRLLESNELWLLVDEIAQSPAVTQAIAHQSIGFADEVARGVRERSRRADTRLERAARGVLHRAPRRLAKPA